MNNTVSFNFAMRHNSAANSIQVDPSVLPSQAPFTTTPQYSDLNSANLTINTNPAELRQQIDMESDIMMALDASIDPQSNYYDLDNLISLCDMGTFDDNLLNSNLENNDFS